MQFKLQDTLKKSVCLVITKDVNIGKVAYHPFPHSWDCHQLVMVPVFEPGISNTSKDFAYSLTTITSIVSLLSDAV